MTPPPEVDSAFHPQWNGDGTDVRSFANQLGHYPVLLQLEADGLEARFLGAFELTVRVVARLNQHKRVYGDLRMRELKKCRTMSHVSTSPLSTRFACSRRI